MIKKPTLIYRMIIDMIPRLDLAHDDLTRIVALLRNPAVEVWSGTNASSAPAVGYSALGWVAHFAGERARLVALRDAGAGPILQRVYPEVFTSLTSYASDILTIVGYIQTAIDRHGTANEKLTNGERSNLANAIEALLA